MKCDIEDKKTEITVKNEVDSKREKKKWKDGRSLVSDRVRA